MMRRFFLTICACAAIVPASATTQHPAATSDTRGPIKVLIRYPTMHGNDVVFEAGGNLWKTTLSGGVATQLTSDSGFDMVPHFSPNGLWIAFTGQYHGNTDVYVISAAGGPVRRLTYHSINEKIGKNKLRARVDNIVVGWTPDSKNVIFLSRRSSFNPQVMHAFTVPIKGGLPEQIPLPWTGPLSFNANGEKVAYNKLTRVYRPFHRKHYFGGKAQNIWIYDIKTGRSRQITHWKGADVWPMWHRDSIYFTSDRGNHGVENLWSYSLTRNHFSQLTHFKTYDIDFPTLGNDGIALSDGGDLYVYRFGDRKLHKINVRVPINDVSPGPHWINAAEHVTSAGVAPNGELAVFSASGALFTVAAKQGVTQTLTRDPAADERDPAWSPDGEQIAYVLAKGRSDEIALRSATGGPPHLLTHGSKRSYQGPITWSPNGKWITYVDNDQNLWLQNVKTKERYKVTTDPNGRFIFRDLTWSADSDWIAFSRTLPNEKSGLFLYHLTDHSLHGISSGRFSDHAPAFSDDGKYLFFVSTRLANPVFSDFDTSMASVESSGLYATTLAANTPSPLAPRNPKAIGRRRGERKYSSGHKSSSAYPHVGPVNIDFKGLMARAVQLPVPAANITSLVASHGVIYYHTVPNHGLGDPLPGEEPKLRAYDVATRKDRALNQGGAGLKLSADHSTLLYRTRGHWVLRPATFDKSAKERKLNLARMRRWIQPRAEWATSFGEAWRYVRDYFFDPDLLHQHWATLGDRYRRLLPLAVSPNDVTWLIANMIGSLGESHMYIRGGSPYQGWENSVTMTADLGADFALDSKSGRYKLSRIYHGDNSIPGYRAPLAQPGLKVSTGDYVLAINGHPLKAPTNPYALLKGTYDSTVRLRLSRDAKGHGAWTIRVKPVANSAKLRLLAWIRHNRKEVNKLSHGKIGYVYLNDFEATGAREFIRQYYSQMRKQGIIFDDRWNLGGRSEIEQNIFNRIARRTMAMFTTRFGWIHPTPNAFSGYMATLINRGSSSNGDVFPYMFNKDHLGPTIGSRTWGGMRGFNGHFVLLDGARMAISNHSLYTLDSRWMVENIGIIPDITVHDEPGQLNRGYDAQLETAVRRLMQKIKTALRQLPPPPPMTPAFPQQLVYPKCSDSMNTTTCG